MVTECHYTCHFVPTNVEHIQNFEQYMKPVYIKPIMALTLVWFRQYLDYQGSKYI